MARNRLAVVSIVNLVTAWSEFLLCTTLANDQAGRTMPVVLAGTQAGLANGHGQISLRYMLSSSQPALLRLHLPRNFSLRA